MLASVAAITTPLVHAASPTKATPKVAARPSVSATSAVKAAPAPDPTTKPVTIRFVNTGPGVTVRVAGGKWIPLARGQQTVVEATTKSLLYTVARGELWQFSARLDLHNVLSRTVQLVPPGGHLEVVNRSGEDRTITWAGAVLGILPRGKSRLYGPLMTGAKALHATGQRSLDVFAKRLQLGHGGRKIVVLPPVAAGLIVPNPLKEAAQLTIDFQNYGIIRPGARVTVLGLAPGDHRVELIGRRSGKPWNYSSRLQTRGESAPESAALRIELNNLTGERLLLPEAMSGLHDGPIPVDAKVGMLVARRTFRLLLTGEKSRLSYTFDVRPRGGAVQPWALKRPKGTVHFTNATGEMADLNIDGSPTLTLRPNQRLTVRKVPAGALQVRVTTRESKHTFEKGIELPANGHVGWQVSAGNTTLIVENQYREQITLVVDGAPRGAVSPGSIFRLDGIKPGQHTVIARTSWSKRTETATVLVRDGTRTRFVLTPPLATLRVTNPLSEPVDVVVRGRGMGTVKAGGSRVFSTTSGRLVVAVHAVKSGQSAAWSGVIAPGQHLAMPTPSLGGSLLIIRNPTQASIEAQVDNRPPQTIAPGGTLRVGKLTEGKHLVRLRGSAFQQRQRVRVVRGQPPLVVTTLK